MMHFTCYKLHWLHIAYIVNEYTEQRIILLLVVPARMVRYLQTLRIAGTKLDDAAFHRTVGFEPSALEITNSGCGVVRRMPLG